MNRSADFGQALHSRVLSRFTHLCFTGSLLPRAARFSEATQENRVGMLWDERHVLVKFQAERVLGRAAAADIEVNDVVFKALEFFGDVSAWVRLLPFFLLADDGVVHDQRTSERVELVR